jgi:hypothetical protein
VVLLNSRKYAEHCSLIASRFGEQTFTHPRAACVKSEGGSGRLRVGYVQPFLACLANFIKTSKHIYLVPIFIGFGYDCSVFIRGSRVTYWSSDLQIIVLV